MLSGRVPSREYGAVVKSLKPFSLVLVCVHRWSLETIPLFLSARLGTLLRLCPALLASSLFPTAVAHLDELLLSCAHVRLTKG